MFPWSTRKGNFVHYYYPSSNLFFYSFFIFFYSEVNSGFFYKTADEREKLVKAERQFIESRVQKVIELKKKLCDGTKKTLVIVNQKVSNKKYSFIHFFCIS